MTLIVCWSNQDILYCLGDTRISQSAETVTDTGTKIFLVPIKTHVYNDSTVTSTSHHTLGFAFAGSTLLASNTHAIASTCTQLLHNSEDKCIPSLLSIARIYAKVGEYVTKDANSRKHRHFLNFQALIFGFCPVERKLQLAELSPVTTPTTFEIVVKIKDLVDEI
jgi:hypothetical protein